MATRERQSTIPNAGAMSDFIGAFDVPSKVTDHVYTAASRIAGTELPRATPIRWTASFTSMASPVILGLAHPGIRRLSANAPGRNLRTAKPVTSPPNIFASGSNKKTSTRSTMSPRRDVVRIIEKLGIR